MPAVTPRVLIVGDHPSFRATARAVLEAQGFAVAGVGSEQSVDQGVTPEGSHHLII